jgi:8-oxo-dGTP diphosphatase
MTIVVAAVMQRNGRILICRRTPEQPHPLKWEFPGGKVEAGETPEAALVRELEEELGVQATIESEITRYQFAYPGKKPIQLIFFSVRHFADEPQNRVFHEMRWEKAEALPEYDFLEGDLDFVRNLKCNRG